MDNIANHCRYLLTNSPEANQVQEYLDSRISKSSQELFQLGFYPPPNQLSLLTYSISEQELKNQKLLYTLNINDSLSQRKINISYFEHHSILFPFKNPYGKTIALVARTLIPEQERKNLKIVKYKNTIFKKSNYLFGLYENQKNILETNQVFLVEGQFDAIKATEAGLNNVVALGSSYLTPNQLALILRYTNNIHLLLDNDEAGKKGKNLILKKYDCYANFINHDIPEPFKDIAEFLETNSINDLNL
jgi:DNA primase